MTKLTLGISAFYHDSAAALLRDTSVVAAAQEERFSRVRHDPRFPVRAVNYCLEEAGIEPEELDAIVFYDKPLLTWDRVVKNCIAAGARRSRPCLLSTPKMASAAPSPESWPDETPYATTTSSTTIATAAVKTGLTKRSE